MGPAGFDSCARIECVAMRARKASAVVFAVACANVHSPRADGPDAAARAVAAGRAAERASPALMPEYVSSLEMPRGVPLPATRSTVTF